ncbi:hypothetical protein ARMSODRAFT_989963 [Armillaria solidipes]|uniref:Uncharacterized protein n=1 Tax=Armillaria solidipes TaxID=1076256 RepID=A0A2H3B624_9AGAR|nr:hypothetical protein ARMSODRAFT_989963 [Armillaria solidipes]
MAIPDMWIKLLKHKTDDEKYVENRVAYCESREQALIGDKTLILWVMYQEMDIHMLDFTPITPVISRCIALYKMNRLLTYSTLIFERNESGHPEWLDFPREGNDNSFQYARRQWNVVDDPVFRYTYLNSAMTHADEKSGWPSAQPAYVSMKHEVSKVIVYERVGLLFFTYYRVWFDETGKERQVMKGGSAAPITSSQVGNTLPLLWNGTIGRTGFRFISGMFCWARAVVLINRLRVYVPTRTCLVLAKRSD